MPNFVFEYLGSTVFELKKILEITFEDVDDRIMVLNNNLSVDIGTLPL